MAPYKESTCAQRNIQRPSNPFVQKREVVKRYTRQSQTLKVTVNDNTPWTNGSRVWPVYLQIHVLQIHLLQINSDPCFANPVQSSPVQSTPCFTICHHVAQLRDGICDVVWSMTGMFVKRGFPVTSHQIVIKDDKPCCQAQVYLK